MKAYSAETLLVALVTIVASALMPGCYVENTRGTQVLYRGERRPADSVATIVVTAHPGRIVTGVGDYISLRDTLELTPGKITLMLGPTDFVRSGRVYYSGGTSLHSSLQRQSKSLSSTRNYTYSTASLCWELTFDAAAGHVYDLTWDTAASHDVELVLIDRADPGYRVKALSGQTCR